MTTQTETVAVAPAPPVLDTLSDDARATDTLPDARADGALAAYFANLPPHLPKAAAADVLADARRRIASVDNFCQGVYALTLDGCNVDPASEWAYQWCASGSVAASAAALGATDYVKKMADAVLATVVGWRTPSYGVPTANDTGERAAAHALMLACFAEAETGLRQGAAA